MTLMNSDFNIQGTAFLTLTTMSMDAENIHINTRDLTGGMIYFVGCNPMTDVVVGEVMLKGITLDGPRMAEFKYGGLWFNGPMNFTLTESFIGSHGSANDGKPIVRADSPLGCIPDDGVSQYITISHTTFEEYYGPETKGTALHGFMACYQCFYLRPEMYISF